MKKSIITLAYLLIITSIWAQAPEKMSYQAVIRNASNQLVTSTSVGMQISILQDSATGTAVYVETQTPTTNANGLVSLEIGTGTVVSGDFSTIEWANDTYFIKTETDPTGGTNYTITGISQLLSVPYALHATTTERFKDGNVGIGTTTPNSTLEIQATAISGGEKILRLSVSDDTLSYLDFLNSTMYDNQYIPALWAFNGIDNRQSFNFVGVTSSTFDNGTNPLILFNARVDGAEIQNRPLFSWGNYTSTKMTMAANGDLGIGTSTPAYKLDVDGDINFTGKIYKNGTPLTYQVGDFAQGGIVFWVDETGQHGLVCAKSDQDGGSGIRWHAGTSGITRAGGNGPYAGEANTAIIIAAQVAIGDDGNDYAAQICNELQITEGGKTYGDWYLPSRDELNLMYQNKTIINSTATANGGVAFASTWYWSSTEVSHISAWGQGFVNGGQISSFKSSSLCVRAIRAF